MTPQVSKIAVRVSTDPRFGYGHIARQCSVRRHLDAKVSWFTDPYGAESLAGHIPAQDDIIEEKDKNICEEIFRWANTNKNCVLICDSYHISPSSFDMFSNKVFFFCDYAQEQVNKNITLVNAQPTAKPSKIHMFGPTYFAIDTRGKSQQALDFSTLDTPINCLISFGSVDSGNLTGKTLAAILDNSKLRKWLRPICLIGQYNRFRKSVEKQLLAFRNAQILDGITSISDLPVSCPIAVGAPGISHAERLFAGIATVLIPQNPNHVDLCKAWEKLGCGVNSSLNPEHISSCLLNLVTNKFLSAQSLSLRGQSVINGRGAERIAAKIRTTTDDA